MGDIACQLVMNELYEVLFLLFFFNEIFVVPQFLGCYILRIYTILVIDFDLNLK